MSRLVNINRTIYKSVKKNTVCLILSKSQEHLKPYLLYCHGNSTEKVAIVLINLAGKRLIYNVLFEAVKVLLLSYNR